jgi:heme A synthase
MPEVIEKKLTPAQHRLDRQLLLSLMLSPVAAGISTIVGFTVAHWIIVSEHTRTGFLVSACSFALCAAAALLAWNVRQKLGDADDTLPENGRRLFMSHLALLLAALCTLVVLAGTLVLFTLRPGE